jgi:hypothetical protein
MMILGRLARIPLYFILFLPHQFVGIFVALPGADRFTERDPRVIQRVFTGKRELQTDRAFKELDRDCGRLLADEKPLLHDAPPLTLLPLSSFSSKPIRVIHTTAFF